MPSFYYVRYGLMGRVGRFAADADAYERGQVVVLRSPRGTELGEVLAPARVADDVPPPSPPLVVRLADRDDLELARQAEADRPRRLAVCERIFRDGDWPLQLIDVEPLLDDGRTVLHYLGPHRLDASGLIAALRVSCDLDILLEPAGRDADELDRADEPAEAHACGSCGTSGGCGAGGGCSTDRREGACSSCAVKSLLLSRRA